jgi:hypothetical protein
LYGLGKHFFFLAAIGAVFTWLQRGTVSQRGLPSASALLDKGLLKCNDIRHFQPSEQASLSLTGESSPSPWAVFRGFHTLGAKRPNGGKQGLVKSILG